MALSSAEKVDIQNAYISVAFWVRFGTLNYE